MNAMYKFISPETVYALGIMLIHFMWQALVLALFLGFFMLVTRKSSPVPRYYAAIFSLFILPVMAVVTFIRALNSMEVAVVANSVHTGGGAKLILSRSLMDKFLSLYADYLPIIVFLWFIGITALLLKNLGGLIIVQRLKSYYIEPVGESVRQMVDQIRHHFNIRRTIQPLISSKVTSPMVIGHFKPVVLIPIKLAGSLTSDEMKIVLRHELAHIKRNDFLINLFQLIIESLFFFHPATWWISHIARQEREECCDVIAAETSDEKITLAKALTSIQEYKLKTNSMAMALLNKKSGFYNRIKNIFGNRPSSPSFREGVIVMLFVFVSTVFLSFVIIKKSNTAEKKHWKTVQTELSNGDYMFAKIDSTGALKELFVNGEKVNKGRYAYYQAAIDSLQSEERYSQKSGGTSHSDDALDRSEKDDWAKGMEAMKEMKEQSPGFSFNSGEENGNVNMSASENGFKMKVNDGNDQVDMNFGENGGHMIIKENGKTTFQMNINTGGVKMKIDTSEDQETEKETITDKEDKE